MKKIFSSILIGLLLTANVALGSTSSSSPVAACTEVVMPQYYQPGITAIDIMQVIGGECRAEITQELIDGGMDPTDRMTYTAAALFYATNWLNVEFQKLLDYVTANNPKAKA